MAENDELYFVLDEGGNRVTSKAVPMSEAREIIRKTLEESQKNGKPKPVLTTKQYLKG